MHFAVEGRGPAGNLWLTLWAACNPRVLHPLAQTKDGQKMGKSLGNVLEPRALLAAYGPDAVRFYFLKEVVFGQVRPCSECTTPVSTPPPACQVP